jgi:hypothetical protein
MQLQNVSILSAHDFSNSVMSPHAAFSCFFHAPIQGLQCVVTLALFQRGMSGLLIYIYAICVHALRHRTIVQGRIHLGQSRVIEQFIDVIQQLVQIRHRAVSAVIIL